MTCNRIQSLLSAYVDRELSGVEMFLVRQHVYECERCAAEEMELRKVRSAISSMQAIEPAPGFQERLAQAVVGAAATQEAAVARRVPSAYGAVGIGIAAALCAFYAWRGNTNVVAAASSKSTIPSPSPRQGRFASSNISVSLQRDRAFMNSSDPLTGPQLAVAASYGR